MQMSFLTVLRMLKWQEQGLVVGSVSADDHHAFHEDAKPGDLAGQFGTRSLSSSNQFTTSITSGGALSVSSSSR